MRKFDALEKKLQKKAQAHPREQKKKHSKFHNFSCFFSALFAALCVCVSMPLWRVNFSGANAKLIMFQFVFWNRLSLCIKLLLHCDASNDFLSHLNGNVFEWQVAKRKLKKLQEQRRSAKWEKMIANARQTYQIEIKVFSHQLSFGPKSLPSSSSAGSTTLPMQAEKRRNLGIRF